MALIKVIELRLLATTDKARAALDLIAARADAIGRLDPSVKVRVDRTAFTQGLAVLHAETRLLARGVTVPVKVDPQGLDRTRNSIRSLAATLAKFGTGFGAAIPGVAGGGAAAAGPAGIAGAAAAAGLAVTALVSGLGGIIPALVSAGLGVAAFGLLSQSTFTGITGGVTAVGAAVGKVAKDKAWDAIPKALRPAVGGVLGLQAAFGKLATAIQPLALKVFSEGLAIAAKLLPYLLPFAKAAGTAILGLLKGFDGFASSPGFKQFMAQMLKLAGPTITTIGLGLGRVAIAAGKLMLALMNPDALRILRIIFDTLQWGISGTAWLIKGFTTNTVRLFHDVAVVFDGFRHAVAGVAHDAAHNFDAVRRSAAIFGHDVAHYFDDVRHGAAVFGHDVAGVFDNVRHFLAHAGDDMRHWYDVADTAVRKVTGFFGGLPGKILGFLSKMVSAGTSLVTGVWRGMTGELSAVGGVVSRIGGAIIGAVKHFFGIHSPSSVFAGIGANLMQGLFQGMVGGASGLAKWVISQIKNLGASAVSNLLGLFGGATGSSGGRYPGAGGGPGGGAPAANAALARSMMPAWANGALWQDWNAVAMRESGWNQYALNASSGAYGIPQALPPTKMPFAAQAAGGSNPRAQIGWMIGYIQQRYGSPIGAWQHELSAGWYDQGGYLPRGLSLAMNNTGSAEVVTPAAKFDELIDAVDNLAGLLAEGNRITAAAPAILGDALNGGARSATYRALYGTR